MWVVVVISTRPPRATNSAAKRKIAVVFPPLPVNATTSQLRESSGASSGANAAIPSASANVGTASCSCWSIRRMVEKLCRLSTTHSARYTGWLNDSYTLFWLSAW